MHTPILANELLSAFANPKRGFLIIKIISTHNLR